MVVVEVDVGVAAPRQQVAGKRPQGALAVSAAILAGGAVKPQVAEPARDPRRAQRDEIMLAERGPVRLEQVADLADVPGRTAKLHGVAELVLRQLLEELLQAIRVRFVHLRRQLPEDDGELLSEPEDEIEIPLDAGARIRQPLHVGEVSASLGREAESVRRSFAPAVHGVRGRQPVEGRVQLHRGEDLRIVLEPLPGRQSLRIEDVAPVVVDVAAGAEMDHVSKVRSFQAWRTPSSRPPPRSCPSALPSTSCGPPPPAVPPVRSTGPAPRPCSVRAFRRRARSSSASSLGTARTRSGARSSARQASSSIAPSRKPESIASWCTSRTS